MYLPYSVSEELMVIASLLGVDSKHNKFFISYMLYHTVTSKRAVEVFMGMQ